MARQERAVRTRRTILEAAGAVCGEHGYPSTTIAMVLTPAEATKGALSFPFPSKESLARAVPDEPYHRALEGGRAGPIRTGPPVEGPPPHVRRAVSCTRGPRTAFTAPP
ncbi:TetR family transcriptional regulator [Streptomyces griseorubiginosus]|nr:TetR family transcriptional regulator [Streptomyces griseorubiginosus]